MEILSVGIVGGGLMGSGIAQACARAGVPTVLVRGTGAPIDGVRGSIEKALQRELNKGRVTAEERDFALGHLTFGETLAALAQCDLVIESIVEDLEIKRTLYGRLEEVARPGAVFASNTSTLRIALLAAATRRADRFVGLHFFNPAPAMKLVELVPLSDTPKEVVWSVRALVLRMGKTPVVVRDSAGFVVNRLLVPYLLDAVRLVEGGVAAVGDIDTSMQLGAGMPMGPFALMDFIGLDVVLAMSKLLYADLQESRLSPPALLRKLVLDGALGRKSGRGFYDYSQTPPVPARGVGPRHLVPSADRPAVSRDPGMG